MSKTLIYILLIVLGVIIAYVILGDLVKNNMQKPTKNPYAFDLREFEHVDAALIKYTESKRIKLNIPGPKAIDYHEGTLVLGFKDQLQAIDTSGREIFKKSIVLNFSKNIRVLFINHSSKYSESYFTS